MKSLHRQKGMSLLGAGLLIFLVIFFGLLFVKLSGSYYDQFTINKMIQTAVDSQSGSRFVKSEFDSRLQKNIDINNIQLNLKNNLKHVKGTNPKLVLDYEKRVHLFANVDVVMSFTEEYEL